MGRLPLLEKDTGGPGARIERASATDLMQLAADVGPMPVQFAALLRLEPTAADPARIGAVLAQRAAGIPRLRQVLRRAPVGCGRPVWVDEPSFQVRVHVRRASVRSRDPDVLLHAAASLVATPMGFARPLWRAAVLMDPSGRARGVVIAVHHVLADGIGGLSVLAQLVDGAGTAQGPPAPTHPNPTAGQLFTDAMRARVAAVRGIPGAVAAIPASVTSLSLAQVPASAETSLARPVSGRLEVAAATLRLADLRDAARARGATVNDAVLTAVGGAVAAVLDERGEPVDRVHISAPVSLRAGSGSQLGNSVATMLLAVPTQGDPVDRLQRVADLTRTRKAQVRAASTSALEPVFRGMAGVGLLRPFIEHQRRIQAFVSNVPGPPVPVSLAGARVVAITPMTTLAGNVPISFLALSYAGELTVSISADPAALPDPGRAAALLETELGRLARLR